MPSLTAFENVLIPMEIAGRRDATDRARQLVEEVGLSDRAHHYPSQLSGGEQQRIAIARALANDPPIVLADEPTGNLDSTTGRHIMDLLLNVRRSRASTLVLVTHDAELASLADTRLVLRDGVRCRRMKPRESCRRGAESARDDLRHPNGVARDQGVLAAPPVLLRLHRRRRGVDRRHSLGDSERASGADARSRGP